MTGRGQGRKRCGFCGESVASRQYRRHVAGQRCLKNRRTCEFCGGEMRWAHHSEQAPGMGGHWRCLVCHKTPDDTTTTKRRPVDTL